MTTKAPTSSRPATQGEPGETAEQRDIHQCISICLSALERTASAADVTAREARSLRKAKRLIAAAPDLLAALIRAQDHLIMSEGAFVCDGKIGYSSDWKEALQQVRDALTKATQQPS